MRFVPCMRFAVELGPSDASNYWLTLEVPDEETEMVANLIRLWRKERVFTIERSGIPFIITHAMSVGHGENLIRRFLLVKTNKPS